MLVQTERPKLVLVQAEVPNLPPKLMLEMARLLQAEVPNLALALVLESQEPGQAARLVQAELQAEPRPEQEPPPGQEKPSGQACTEMPIS